MLVVHRQLQQAVVHPLRLYPGPVLLFNSLFFDDLIFLGSRAVTH